MTVLVSSLKLIDKHLSWKNHIDSIVTNISKNVGLIVKLCHFVPRPLLLNIYKSLINSSLFNLWSCCLGSEACKTYLNKILILQKTALCLLYFVDWHDYAIPLFPRS